MVMMNLNRLSLRCRAGAALNPVRGFTTSGRQRRGKGLAGLPRIPDPPSGTELADQSGHLLTVKAGNLAQVLNEHALVGLGKPRIAQLAQSLSDPVIGLIPRGSLEVHAGGPARKARICSSVWSPWVWSFTIILR